MAALLREEARAARRKVEGRGRQGDPPSGDGIYGHAAAASRSCSPSSATPAPSAWAWSGRRRPRVCCIAAALTELAERPVRLVRWPSPARSPANSSEQVDKALAEQPDVALIMIGANDVTTPDQARGLGAPPRGRRPPAHRDRLRGRRRHLSRPRARSGRSPSRCARWPAGGAGRWPPPRRSPSSRPAAARCPSARCSARRSPPTATCSAWTSSTRVLSATPRRPPCCCPRSPTPSACGPPRPTAACARSAAAPSGRSRGPPPGPPAAPAPRSSRPRSAGRTPAPGAPGRCCAAAGRRRSPRPDEAEEAAEAPGRRLTAAAARAGRGGRGAATRGVVSGAIRRPANSRRARLIVEDPCPKPSSSRPPAPPSAAPSRGRSRTCAPTTSPPPSCAPRWTRCPRSTRPTSTT